MSGSLSINTREHYQVINYMPGSFYKTQGNIMMFISRPCSYDLLTDILICPNKLCQVSSQLVALRTYTVHII